jgi:hypothetical protein
VLKTVAILAFLVIFSTKLSGISGIKESSFVFTAAFYLSIFFGIINLILDSLLKKLESRFNEFQSNLINKEDFYKVFIEVMTVEPRFNFKTKNIELLQENLSDIFDLHQFESYIYKWKNVNSIFSYQDQNEHPEPTLLLPTLPYTSLFELANLIGTKEFSRLILTASIKHDLINVLQEIIEVDKIRIIYKLNKNPTPNNVLPKMGDS